MHVHECACIHPHLYILVDAGTDTRHRHKAQTQGTPPAAQVALIGIQFIWTLDSEDALYRSKTEKGVMNSTNRKNLQRLNDMIAINLKTDQELAEYGKWTRKKVETMILVDVHQRDVFDELVKRKIKARGPSIAHGSIT